MSKPGNITILVADDHKMFRTGLIMELESIPGLEPIGEAETAEEAIDLAAELRPDVILMDIEMLGISGLEATRRLMVETPDPPRVLILTTFDNNDYLVEAYQSGADGYLLKTITGPELDRKVRNVLGNGGQEFPDRAPRLVPQYKAREKREADEIVLARKLTPSEITILTFVDRGFSYKQVAKQLNVSKDTIKKHLANARTKLGVTSSREAASLARRTGRIGDRG